jgi:hypothetical protein
MEAIMTDKAIELLKRLEWSGSAYGPGVHMGDVGRPYPACPICFQVKPNSGAGGDFNPSAFGHKRNCELKSELESHANF